MVTQERLGIRGEPIIRAHVHFTRRLGLGLVAVLLLAGCGISTSSPPQPQGSPSLITHKPSASPSAGQSTVWVLSPIGLNVRSSPDLNASRTAILSQGAALTILEQRKVGAQTWLHIHSQSGLVEGWVVDAPETVIHQAVAQHLDIGWSILFPDKWTFKEGNPATFTSSPSDPDGGLLLVQTADDPAKLLTTPLTAGKELREEAPIEIYGKTTFLTIYKLDSGGFEFASTVRSDSKRAFLFDYKQSARAEADTSLFRQLLESVILT